MSSNAELRDDVIFLKGRIDSNNADETAAVIRKLILENIIGLPVFDASELKYISSAGLRILLGISKRYKGKPRVINVSKEVYDVLDATGFTELLDVRNRVPDHGRTFVAGSERHQEGEDGQDMLHTDHRFCKNTEISVYLQR